MESKFIKMFLYMCPLLGFFSSISVYSANYKSEVIVDNLDNPWSIAFISKSEWLVTELSGSLRRVINGEMQDDPVSGVPEAFYYGQGGLSAVVLHPNFKENKLV